MPLSEDSLTLVIMSWMQSNADCERGEGNERMIFDDHASFDARAFARYLIDVGIA